MQKTVIDWLIELKEPYRTEAIRNSTKETLYIEVNCDSTALATAFIWKDSPQGYNYWSRIHISLLYKRDYK